MIRHFLNYLFIYLQISCVWAQDLAIPIEAENAGTIGSDFNIQTEEDVTYVTAATDFASATNPGNSDKILTFEITFDAPGTYDLYVKLRVGPEGANDDSFYFGSDFGTRAADVDADWIRVNSIGNGSAAPNAYVLSSEENAAGNQVFKWINASETGEGAAGGTLFTVESDGLSQTFQIGSRENGLDIDKIAFGNADLFYTVSNLENGEAGVSELPEVENTLIVDLSNPIRPVTHCASGALYGITEDLPGDIEALVDPLNPNMFVQPARSGSGYQQPIGEALPVAQRLKSTTGLVTIRLADINPGWPYQWVGWEEWREEVSAVILEKKGSNLENIYGFEIWNEQHGTWDVEANGGDFFTVLWKPTYDLIRSIDPDAMIIGPSDSYYQRSRMQDFLEFCLENDCLPDIICWHELLGSDNISANIDNYRSLEASLGFPPREISINEYSSDVHEYEGCPGVSAPFIAKFERKKVHSAAISWWFTNLPGRLGSLLTSSNQKGGGWWFYKWYGDMSGDMVMVTPPGEQGDGLDGFACLSTNSQYASVCFGGNYTGAVDVVINGIPNSFGQEVDVKVEHVPWSNKDSPVSGPVLESTTAYTVEDGTITVPVEVTSPFYGYRVYVSRPGFGLSVDDETEITLHPNPVEDFFTISLPGSTNGLAELSIYLLNGSLVWSGTINEQHKKIHLDALNPGLYLLKIEYNGEIFTEKIIKK